MDGSVDAENKFVRAVADNTIGASEVDMWIESRTTDV